MKRLALQVARNRDFDAAEVLGDMMMETYSTDERGALRVRPGRYGGVETGRVRLALFQCSSSSPRSSITQARRVLTRNELVFLNAPTARALNGALFSVPARETIYGTDHFARWHQRDAIFVMWITSRRDVYRAMIRQRILPSSIRFADLIWENLTSVLHGYRLYIVRVPKGRKKPQRVYLFTITRQDSPATEEYRFEERPRMGTDSRPA